ncbi:UNVERIFIED_CONTAM: hypothetical protein MKS84_14640 [Pseudomonas sp. JL1]
MKGYDKQIYVTFCGTESSKQEMRANHMYLSSKYAEVPNELLSWSEYNNAIVLATKFAAMCGEHDLDFHQENSNEAAQIIPKTFGIYVAVHGAIGSSVIDVEIVGEAIALLCTHAGYTPQKICIDSCHSADAPKVVKQVEDPNTSENSIAQKLGYSLFRKMNELGTANNLINCVLAGYRDVVVKYEYGSRELDSLGMVFPGASEGVHTYYKDGGPKGAIRHTRLRPAPIVVNDTYIEGLQPQFAKKLLLQKDKKKYLTLKDNTNPAFRKYIEALNRYLQKKKAWKFTNSMTWAPIQLDEYSSSDIFKFLEITDSTVTGILNPGTVSTNSKK